MICFLLYDTLRTPRQVGPDRVVFLNYVSIWTCFSLAAGSQVQPSDKVAWTAWVWDGALFDDIYNNSGALLLFYMPSNTWAVYTYVLYIYTERCCTGQVICSMDPYVAPHKTHWTYRMAAAVWWNQVESLAVDLLALQERGTANQRNVAISAGRSWHGDHFGHWINWRNPSHHPTGGEWVLNQFIFSRVRGAWKAKVESFVVFVYSVLAMLHWSKYLKAASNNALQVWDGI